MSTPPPRLGASLAAAHHLLVLASDVEEHEVPVLVRSLVPGADWFREPDAGLPGVLNLLAGDPDLAATSPIPTGVTPAGTDGSPPARATLTGPWRVDLRTRHDLALPEWATTAWVLDVDPERSPPAPDLPGGYGPLLDAFGLRHPIGLEREALDALMRCARRLAGALRVGSGVLLEPDPDSAVDLTIHAPTWLDPEALERVLGPVLIEVEVMPGASMEQAASLDGYGAQWLPEAGVDPVIIEVEAAEVRPAALAAAEWADDGLIDYRLRWTALPDHRSPTTRVGIRRRDHVRRSLELAALALHDAVGGEILDEDGLVVDPAQLLGEDEPGETDT